MLSPSARALRPFSVRFSTLSPPLARSHVGPVVEDAHHHFAVCIYTESIYTCNLARAAEFLATLGRLGDA